MKTTSFAPRQTVWAATPLAALSLLVLLVVSACGGDNTETPPSTVTPAPTAAIAAETLTPTTTVGDLEAMAEDIAADAGKVLDVVQGAPGQIVIVFEETHGSPAGQIEIAIMLNRLYEAYRLRHIGLEGALSEHGSLDTTPFGPSFTAGQLIGPREDSIVQLLEDGEISAAEMMGLIYADADIAGIDSPEYRVDLSVEAANAPYSYLYSIAVAGLTESEMLQAEALLDEGNEDEARDFIVETDEFVKRTLEELDDPSGGCEERLDLIDEIEAKAADATADIEPEYEGNLRDLATFYEACSVRSEAMSRNITALAEQFTGAPVAMQIGAGHTGRMTDLLTNAGVSFAVIRPVSLDEEAENGDLSFEAYDRKLAGQSVDPRGSLGALLDGRRKPPPVVGELWVQSKAELFLLTTLIARAAAQGQLPPFDDALRDVLPQLRNVTLLTDTIEVIGNDVVFSTHALDSNSQPVVVWVRTTRNRELVGQTLNDRLLDALSNVQAKDPPSDDFEPEESEPILQRVSSDTVAKFATDRSTILRARIDV